MTSIISLQTRMMRRKLSKKSIGIFCFTSFCQNNWANHFSEAREVMNMLKSTRGNAREKSQQIMSKFPYELSKELSSSKSLPNFGNASNISESDASAISNDAYLVSVFIKNYFLTKNVSEKLFVEYGLNYL